jgi:hypothetical protein
VEIHRLPATIDGTEQVHPAPGNPQTRFHPYARSILLNRDDVLLPEAQIRVRGKETKAVSCLSHLKPFNCSIIIYGWNDAISTRTRSLFR